MHKVTGEPGYQAYRILQFVFVVAPIIAGLDKFFYFLTNWSLYISPYVMNVVKGNDLTLMSIVGVAEIIVGIGVAFRPRIFSYIVALWMLAVILNLLMIGNYYDIALYDFGLMLAAFSLGLLSKTYATTEKYAKT